MQRRISGKLEAPCASGMGVIAPDVVHFVAWSGSVAALGDPVRVFQRGKHLLVDKEPTAMLVVEVRGTVLEKDSKRLDRILTFDLKNGTSPKVHPNKNY